MWPRCPSAMSGGRRFLTGQLLAGHRAYNAGRLYASSLSLAFAILFVVSFSVHAMAGAARYSAEQLAHGGEPISAWRYLGSAQFWFESFQNWQSEFLAILAMIVLSIFLRQQGSPESKEVDRPHSETGA